MGCGSSRGTLAQRLEGLDGEAAKALVAKEVQKGLETRQRYGNATVGPNAPVLMHSRAPVKHGQTLLKHVKTTISTLIYQLYVQCKPWNPNNPSDIGSNRHRLCTAESDSDPGAVVASQRFTQDLNSADGTILAEAVLRRVKAKALEAGLIPKGHARSMYHWLMLGFFC